MSNRNPAFLAMLGVLAGAALIACASPRSVAAPHMAAIAAGDIATGHCPARSPDDVPYAGTRPDGALVAVNAHTLVLCRYHGLNDPPVLGLSATRIVTDTRLVQAWQRRFNALPVVKAGTYNCPNDDGSSILASFVASATSYAVVKVELRGCQFATNGIVAGRITNSPKDTTFLADLQHLVAG